MNTFVSLSCLGGSDELFDILEAYRSHGIKKVELGSWTKSVALDGNELAVRIRGYGLSYQVHNYFPPRKDGLIVNLASPDKRVLGLSREHTIDSLRFCRDIGARLFTVHAGFCVDPKMGPDGNFIFPDNNSNDYEDAFSLFVDSVGTIGSEAKRMGIGVGIENNVILPDGRRGTAGRNLLMCDAGEFDRLWKEIHSDNLGILLDLGHLKIASAALGFDRDHFVERVKAKVLAVHLHDNDGIRDSHAALKADSWQLDVIRRMDLKDVPVVLEAKRLSMEEIRQQVTMIDAKGELNVRR